MRTLLQVEGPGGGGEWRVVYSIDSGGDIVKVRTKNYDELGHSEHSALEFAIVDIRDIHNIPKWCLLLLSPC